MTVAIENLMEECREILTEAGDALNAEVACVTGCLATPEQAGMKSVQMESARYIRMAGKFRPGYSPTDDEWELALDACRVSAFDLLIQSTIQPSLQNEALQNALRCAKIAQSIREKVLSDRRFLNRVAEIGF